MSDTDKEEKSAGREERVESEAVRDDRSYITQILHMLEPDLAEGAFDLDAAYKPEDRGDLSIRPVTDFVAIYNEIGIDRFDVSEEGSGRPVFSYVDTRGRRFAVACEDVSPDDGTDIYRVHLWATNPKSNNELLLTHELKHVNVEGQEYRVSDTITYAAKTGGVDREVRFSKDTHFEEAYEANVQAKIDALCAGIEI